MRGNMETLVTGTSFEGRVLRLIAATRQPFIAVLNESSESALPPPYIITTRGAVFGFAAVVDFLLHRVPEPPLLANNVVQRGLQLTVFYALVAREHTKLALAEPHEATAWLRDLSPMLRTSKFYTGNELTVCDCALVALIEFLARTHNVRLESTDDYAYRVTTEFAAIARRNADSGDL